MLCPGNDQRVHPGHPEERRVDGDVEQAPTLFALPPSYLFSIALIRLSLLSEMLSILYVQ